MSKKKTLELIGGKTNKATFRVHSQVWDVRNKYGEIIISLSLEDVEKLLFHRKVLIDEEG